MAEKKVQKSWWAEAEEAIMHRWSQDRIFEKTLAKKSPRGTFVFYDGPPFATGLPHYGHIVGSVLKDVVPRYKTMQGYHVPRRWGWDCHGLPIENLIEKELGFGTKKEIIAYGIDKFNEACRSKVMEYAHIWKQYISRLGRFVDMENDYKTMDPSFMESVWWVFKQLWDKGLVYEGYKVMHICPRCETTLSQSEVSEGYRDIKDISATAYFELTDMPGIYLLAWTTTPWTLPGNVALAVNPDISYSIISCDGKRIVVATSLADKVFAGKDYVVEKRDIDITEYVGKRYRPLFPYFADKHLKYAERLYTVQSAAFVTDTDGTGIVHIAPAFGDDDYRLAQAQQLPFIQHVGMDGHFIPEVTDFAGRSVKPREDHQSADIEIIKYLAAKGLLFSKEKIDHSYPHCWRCDTPLLNYAKSSWFVKVTDLKPTLVANNQNTYWFPGHLKDGRSGQWIEGARDWAISRERFWASVMPVWRCQKCAAVVAVGSVAELEEYSGREVGDLHKHIVDEVTFPCACGDTMRRIPEVLDTWFDSGSMPFAQQHYLGTGSAEFDPVAGVNFPADYIAEGVDQTRCWFYYLNIIATGITGTQAFRNVLVNGIVQAEDGQKMSKRLKNYPDPLMILDAYGADALRFYLMSSPVVKAEDLNFSEVGVRETYNKVVNTLWNVCTFHTTYYPHPAALTSVAIDAAKHPMDRWVLSRLQATIQSVTDALERYDLAAGARVMAEFVADLSQWYLRRTRDRIKEGTPDSDTAGSVLLHVLRETAKLLAPYCPFLAEQVYGALGAWKGKLESVHLESWPQFAPSLAGTEIIDQMAAARTLIERALAVRAAGGVKVRQPLSRLYVTMRTLDPDLFPLVADEVNVKEVVVIDAIPAAPAVQTNTDGPHAVALDMSITPELAEEGMIREFTRQINQLRKEQKLTVADRVELVVSADETTAAVLEREREHICAATLADALRFGPGEHELEVNGAAIRVTVIKK